MSQQDQQMFFDALKAARVPAAGLLGLDRKVMDALNRLAMPDMLQALSTVSDNEFANIRDMGNSRIEFAFYVIRNREIKDLGLYEDQINDGREFLGCTRLGDDQAVIDTIDQYRSKAKTWLTTNKDNINDKQWLATAKAFECCKISRAAWGLSAEERRKSGQSLISNLAAAAHYAIAWFHVCSGKASKWQMTQVIDAYDNKKRDAVRNGDAKLSSIAINKGNQPFPVDFKIRSWALRGAEDGDKEHARCNSETSFPVLLPDIEDSAN